MDLFKRPVTVSPDSVRPVVLLILDGWGIAPDSEGNAITRAKTPNWDRYVANSAYGQLIAAGESVGLPANEDGNSEVGHLTLGAGRTIAQSLPRINAAIKDASFLENKAFIDALAHVQKNNSHLHIMGLVSSGEVHSSFKHLSALLDFCKKQDLKNIRLHLFTDGRDAPPTDGLKIITDVEKRLQIDKIGQVATVMGRYWAMDRDGDWEKTQKAYEALVLGRGLQAPSASQALQTSYAAGKTDEFVEPTIITGSQESLMINDNDAVIFFNFRIDRPRQLTMAFVFADFENLKTIDFGYIPYEKDRRQREQTVKGTTFKREKILKNLFFVTMTEYQKNVPVSAIAFPTYEVAESLPQVLSEKGLKQMHLAESEKERMVCYYFDGTRDQRFPGEDVIIVPSPHVATYDKKPEMSVFKLVNAFEKELSKNIYHFFVINFANPDMVAHSGNLQATIKAVEATDKALGELVNAAWKHQGTVLVTADHGNAEELLNYPSSSYYVTTAGGEINTEHSNNPVPIVIVGPNIQPMRLGQGTLADVAPTICAIMKIPKPASMTGRNLLEAKA